MQLTDDTLSQIGSHFRLTEEELVYFIENVRERQAELILKSIYTYFAKHKSAAEQLYLKKITDELERSDGAKEAFTKWENFLSNELTHNPELNEYLQTKLVNFMTDMLRLYAQVVDDEVVIEEVLRSYFANIDIVAAAIKQGQLSVNTN